MLHREILGTNGILLEKAPQAQGKPGAGSYRNALSLRRGQNKLDVRLPVAGRRPRRRKAPLRPPARKSLFVYSFGSVSGPAT
jgi:hypothetical protein